MKLSQKQSEKLEASIVSMRSSLRLRHLAWKTEESYIAWVRRFVSFITDRRWQEGTTSEAKFEAFLSYLAVDRRVSASTQNQAFHAVLFFYKYALKQSLQNIDALRANRPKRERQALTPTQLFPVLRELPSTMQMPIKLICLLLYGCGLRISDGLNLRIKDVLLEEKHLLIRESKGGKDRRVPIPKVLFTALSRQIERARQMWEADVENQLPVEIPDALNRKYPRLGMAWQWAWLFPSPSSCLHPRRGDKVRNHLHEVNIQRAMKTVAARHGLEGLLTPHVLRHCYATHFRGDIQVLQKLLGHSQIETTMGYRHPHMDQAPSPLDDAATNIIEMPGLRELERMVG